ncbi:MAG: hypothetical protein ACYS0E_19385 [Planctomycetota bacterium]
MRVIKFGHIEIVAADPAVAAEQLHARGADARQVGACLCFTDSDGNSFQIVNPNEDHAG